MPETNSQHQAEFFGMLESLVRLIEHQSPAMRCSILLLDSDGTTLRHGAAPSLPTHYCEAIDGLRIGPKVGSCGTAAYTGHTVIVADIATDELWADFRALALPIGLRACWSTPIMGAAGACLGTFAMYYTEPRAPREQDLELINTAALLAGALIEREHLLVVSETARSALAAANETLEEQREELEAANQQLQDGAAELEMLNQQLQENATELEMQAEALEAANAELRVSEERTRDVFEQAPVALAVLTGPDHVYTIVSPLYLEYLGNPALLGRPIAEALPTIATPEVMATLDRIYQSGDAHHQVDRHVRIDRDRDGVSEDYYFNVGYKPLRDGSGAVYAIVIASLDVTDQVAARRELEIARRDAEAANRAKSEFLATMSHELRTPLNAIGGYADLLLTGVRGELTAPQREDVERMKRSGQHLLGLINDILNFAKLEAGQVEFHVADVPVVPLLGSLEELVRPQVDAKMLAYTQTIDEGDLVAQADMEKVRQVLLNLVTNAVKFTEPGGRISVSCVGDAAAIRISVSDTGRGIPAEHLARIFDPFVQIDRERTPKSQQGVGLGLSISRDLAQAMGGSLSAQSTVGEGSTFTLTLPRAAQTAVEAPASTSAEPAASPAAAATLELNAAAAAG
ncbi:MAG TPA: ATP-binding protein [Gemmatimonadaceae bacterium]|nr:ATP-binding protein [Gemmatimonadaceae bacterium]